MKLVTALALAALVVAPSVGQAIDRTGKEYNTLYAGLGIKGYDPVAYFTDGKAVQGVEQFSHSWKGVTWHFASQAHRDAFAKNPEQYAPQYGGFCAWGISVGKLFDIDPVDAWTIVDGKLYINFNAQVKEMWAKDAQGFIAKAQGEWPKLDR